MNYDHACHHLYRDKDGVRCGQCGGSCHCGNPK